MYLLVDFAEHYPGAVNAKSAETILEALRAKTE